MTHQRRWLGRKRLSRPSLLANQIGLTETSPSRAAALVDLDRDGRLDVLIARQFKSTQVLRNVGVANSKTGNWIGLKLVGDSDRDGCNRQAVGSKVTVQGLQQEVQLTNGLSSQGDGELHFGLGQSNAGVTTAETVKVEVEWCGQRELKTYQLATGQRHILEQRPGKGSKRLAGPSKQGDQI